MKPEWNFNQKDAFTVWDHSRLLKWDSMINHGMCTAITYYVLKRMLANMLTSKAILDGHMGDFASMQRGASVSFNIKYTIEDRKKALRANRCLFEIPAPRNNRSEMSDIETLARGDGLECDLRGGSDEVADEFDRAKDEMEEKKDEGTAAVASFLSVWNAKRTGHGICMCLGGEKVGTVAFDPNLGYFRMSPGDDARNFFDYFFFEVQQAFGEVAYLNFAILSGTPRDRDLLGKSDVGKADLEERARKALQDEDARKELLEVDLNHGSSISIQPRTRV